MSRGTGIPLHALLACEPIGPGLSAAAAGEAVSRGMQSNGAPTPELVAIPARLAPGATARATLDRLGIEERMRAARGVVLVTAGLREETLAGSPAFVLATSARQAGVPCYAVAAVNELDSFDLRILDLQVVLEAGTIRGLSAAGRRLAKLL